MVLELFAVVLTKLYDAKHEWSKNTYTLQAK